MLEDYDSYQVSPNVYPQVKQTRNMWVLTLEQGIIGARIGSEAPLSGVEREVRGSAMRRREVAGKFGQSLAI